MHPLERKISQTTSNVHVGLPAGTWTKDEISFFVKKSSLTGLAAIKLFLSAGQAERFVSSAAVFEPNDTEYVFGFLMGVDASGLINVSSPDDLDLTFKAIENASGLAAAVDAEWQSRLESDDQQEASDTRELNQKISAIFADAG